jgi:DNA-binding transcriptional LysR family regulator
MDSFTELGVFARVVDLGGFTRAAANLGLTPSGVRRAESSPDWSSAWERGS